MTMAVSGPVLGRDAITRRVLATTHDLEVADARIVATAVFHYLHGDPARLSYACDAGEAMQWDTELVLLELSALARSDVPRNDKIRRGLGMLALWGWL